MKSYLRYNGSALPGLVGTVGDDGLRLSDGREGHLSYGPYVSLAPGNYVAGFYIRRIGTSVAGELHMDVFADGDKTLALKKILDADLFDDIAALIPIPFEVTQKVDRVEIRIYVGQGVMIEIRELVIFSTQPRDWGGK